MNKIHARLLLTLLSIMAFGLIPASLTITAHAETSRADAVPSMESGDFSDDDGDTVISVSASAEPEDGSAPAANDSAGADEDTNSADDSSADTSANSDESMTMVGAYANPDESMTLYDVVSFDDTPGEEKNFSDDALASYIDGLFSADGSADGSGETLLGTSTLRRNKLSSAEAALYDAMYQKACDIADGKADTAIVTFSLADVGYADVSLSNVLYALLDDCPGELYWYDKTMPTQSYTDHRGVLRVYMPVSYTYSASGMLNTYQLNTALMEKPRRALETARSIASAAYGASLYDALDYYRNWICENVSYNYAALGTSYADPWQIIYVFDGDPTTQVVCEGYAKAFKYLTDQWEQANSDSEAANYIVEGTLDGGAHMWNVVHMDDGRNYLADITGCDSLSNQRDLFLKGYTDVSNGYFYGQARMTGYTVSVSDGRDMSYSYILSGTSPSMQMYTNSEIAIAGTDYDPDSKVDRFRDVRDTSSFYYNPVYDLAGKGIVAGTSPSTFSPDARVTRAQFVLFLYRMAGRPSIGNRGGSNEIFSDIRHSFAHDAIVWAAVNGITTGTGNGKFEPDRAVTREQAATFLWRYNQLVNSDSSAYTPTSSDMHSGNAFSDVREGAYYADAVAWAQNNGITVGYNGRFGVGDACTRGQAVTFLWRYENAF